MSMKNLSVAVCVEIPLFFQVMVVPAGTCARDAVKK